MVNIGVIGCGYWGVNYIRVFNELADSHVTKVCDKRAERLNFARQRYVMMNHFHLLESKYFLVR